MRGVGIDTVEVQRIAKKCERPGFVELAFTANEMAYCDKQAKPAEHYAARFAAKEAYMKALGTGWSSEANFKQIEIERTESGAPRIQLHGEAAAYFENEKYQRVELSLSHTAQSAVAIVILL